MNNDDIHNFKKDTENLRLTKTEKSLMRARLFDHVENTSTPSIPSPYTPSPLRTHWYGAYALVALLVIIVPTAFAANQSLPGNPLYPIKVSVLEPVEEALASSPDRRVALAIENAENRVRETATLLENHGDPEDIALASANLTEKVSKTRKDIEALNTQDIPTKIDLQKDLLTVLETYSAVVEDEDSLDEATSTLALEEAADSVEDDIRDSIDSFSTAVAPEEVTEEVTDTIAETQDRIDDTPTEIDDKTIDDNQRKILEAGLTSTQQELSEQDSASALEVLIFSNQDADVIGKLNELQGGEEEGTSREETATTSEATSSIIVD